MISYRKQREARRRLRFSAMGKASQRVQAERRMADLTERLREMEEIEVQNLPRSTGDALGCLTWIDYRTGQTRKLVIRIGARRDQITLESPGGKPSKSHGWAWALTKLRMKILTPTPTAPILHASGDALHGVGLPVGSLSR